MRIATLALLLAAAAALMAATPGPARAEGRVWVHEKICNIETRSQCVEWSTTEDVQIAPPGWIGVDGEACVWRDDLNAGKCRPMEGWAQNRDPVSKSDLLLRNYAPLLIFNLTVDTARAWNDLSGWEQINVRLGRATIYDFIVFTRSDRCSKPENALACRDTWARRDAQPETIASPQPAPAPPAKQPKTSQPKQVTPPGSAWPPAGW
jgi:hypothetical protein